MEKQTENYLKKIYDLWHEFAASQQIHSLLKLYAEDAILDNPLVPTLLNYPSRMLKGHEQIKLFLQARTQPRINEFMKAYKTSHSLIQEDIIVCEYQYVLFNKKPMTVIEMMEVKSNKIKQHKVYWCN